MDQSPDEAPNVTNVQKIHARLFEDRANRSCPVMEEDVKVVWRVRKSVKGSGVVLSLFGNGPY
jgi:hypothetical protein